MNTSDKIAFLGIGLMGSRQATRLLEAGCRVTVWNRSREKAEALRPLGADVADTAQEAVSGADVVFTMFENGQVVEDVLFRQHTAEAMTADSMLIDTSSIKPSEARENAHRLAERGVRCLDAPVSGGPTGATAGTLAIMAGGEEADFERARPLLSILGRPVHVGPHGAGQLAKLANQIIVGVTIGAISEALALAAAGGADPARVREALRGGFAESRILDLHGQRMVERNFATASRSVTQLKDLKNALDAAARIGMDNLPLTGCAAALFADLVNHAGDVDHSGLILEIERRNGL
jgi:2-hydroxy-3-oxopropionate reductase